MKNNSRKFRALYLLDEMTVKHFDRYCFAQSMNFSLVLRSRINNVLLNL